MQGLHTGPSGDWHADSSAPARRLQPHDPSRRPVDPPLPAVEREVEEAIRPLLEAAPKLLEAAEDLLAYMEGYEHDYNDGEPIPQFAVLRTAIASARRAS